MENETETIPVITPVQPTMPATEFSEKIIGEVVPGSGSSKGNLGGKMVILLIALAVISLGAIAYFIFSSSKTPVVKIEEVTEEVALPTSLPTPTATPSVFPEQSSSDEISAIETDLNVTDFENIDQGLVAIENEL